MNLNLQQLRTLLLTVTHNGNSIPVVYYQFAEGENVTFPAISYYETGTENIGADNIVYKKVRNITIDLYTERKELNLENQLEQILTENKIYFDSVSSYIESEKLYLTRYEITIL